MRVLRQSKVPRVEVLLVTIWRENIRPSKKEINKFVTLSKIQTARCLQLDYETLRRLIAD
jgi:hypothetical protein